MVNGLTQNTFFHLWNTLKDTYKTHPVLISEETNEAFSFKEIAKVVSALIGLFHSQNIHRGECITLYSQPNPEYCCVIWAAWLSGIVIVPLDVDLSPTRVQQIFSETKSKLLFLGSAPRIGFNSTRFIIFDGVDLNEQAKPHSFSKSLEAFFQSPQKVVNSKIEHTDPAVILFTSGSSGDPKGVILTQGSLYRTSCTLKNTYAWNSTDKFLVISGFHAMSPLRNFTFAALMAGGTIVISKSCTLHPPEMARLIEQYQITQFSCTPATLNRFIQYKDRLPKSLFASLKAIISTGASLSPLIKNAIWKWLEVPIYNYYGLTETGGVCILESPKDNKEPDTIGTPAPYSLVQIVNKSLQPVKKGQIGELRVFGVNNSIGYFTPGKPIFIPKNNARWINTSDLAQWTDSGKIKLLGRKDFRFKNKQGEVVYCSEVEKILEQHHQIMECCALSIPDANAEEKLIAFIILKTSRISPSLFELLDFSNKYLGSKKTPDDFVFLSDFPRNANGKVDRTRLTHFYKENNHGF